MTSALDTQSCASCAHIHTEIVRPQGSEPKRLVVTCEKEHAPIWLFSGAECKDYQSKQSYLQEHKCTKN